MWFNGYGLVEWYLSVSSVFNFASRSDCVSMKIHLSLIIVEIEMLFPRRNGNGRDQLKTDNEIPQSLVVFDSFIFIIGFVALYSSPRYYFRSLEVGMDWDGIRPGMGWFNGIAHDFFLDCSFD